MENKNLNTHNVKDAISKAVAYIEKLNISSKARLQLIQQVDKQWELVFELEKDKNNYGMVILIYDIENQLISVKKIVFDNE